MDKELEELHEFLRSSVIEDLRANAEMYRAQARVIIARANADGRILTTDEQESIELLFGQMGGMREAAVTIQFEGEPPPPCMGQRGQI